MQFSAPKTQASVRTIGVADFVLDAVAARVATYGTHRGVDLYQRSRLPRRPQHMVGHKSATETRDTYRHLIGDEDDRSRAVIQAALGTPLQAQLVPTEAGE